LACSFGGLHLEADGTLWRGEQVVHLTPKELAALRLLTAHAGNVVSLAQLKQALWGNLHVTADSVPQCISGLRTRLEPDVCIQTVYKRGYRFTAKIARHAAAQAETLPRLAIMPFATRYSVPEYLGAAIAEETTAILAGAHPGAVAVLARDSVFNLTQQGLTACQLGKELKADLVMTGSLQAFSSHYRLRAEMIRVEDEVQIWVEDMLAPKSRSGVLEQELMHRLTYRLAKEASGGLQVSTETSSAEKWDGKPSPPEPSRTGLEICAEAEPISLPEMAYEIFQRGHHDWQTLQRHRMQDGLQYLLRAIELDPTLIAAKVDLAHLCITEAFYGFMPPSVSAEFVHDAAESIPDFPAGAEALLPALGWINFHFDRNLSAALRAFSLSAHLPHNTWVTRARTMFALSRHRFSEAIALLRAAIQVDSYSPWMQTALAWALHLDGQAAESVEQSRNAINRFPDNEFICFYTTLILAYNGEPERAAQIAQKLGQRMPSFDLATAAHAYALACANRRDEARALLQRLHWLSRERFLLNSFIPAVDVALGDLDAALVELRVAEREHCPWFFQMLADPRLKALHGNPEFEKMQAILTNMETAAGQNMESEN
jgi:DNA-binding winged helix-turn-helix (wHTH) protein